MVGKWMVMVWCLLGIGMLRAAEVRAELSNDVVEAGQGVMLSVTVEGGSPDGEPEIPAVDGLVVNPRGPSYQMSMTNGRVSRSVGYRYVVGSNQAGEFTIPAIAVRIGGEELKTEPLRLTVRGEPDGMEDDEIPGGEESYGFLTFQLGTNERDHVYPGEIAPVRIRAYFQAGTSVSLSGPPRPDGSAFTLHNLTQQREQSVELINGVRHQVVTWYGGLSATKAGEYPASFSLEGTVAVRERGARRQRGGPFGDPFFDDVFAPVVRKEMTLQTPDPPQVEVRELPQAGRPEDFSGAIGRFEFESVAMPELLTTGEPCQIEARLAGEGNFALLQAPLPLPAENWKTYPESGEFNAGDQASFSGSKAFRYSAVPLVPGDEEVRLRFSYFDPEAGEYRSVESAPRRVEIRGEPVVTPQAAAADEPLVEVPDEPGLAPLRMVPGAVGSYAPLSEEIWFYPVIGGCGVLAAGILGVGIWRGREQDPVKAARREEALSVRAAVARADEAAGGGEALEFFVAAREALQWRVAGLLGVRPGAVTLAEVARVADRETVDLFHEADRVDYSGRAGGGGDLGAWKEALHRALEKLENGGRRDAS